MAVRKRRAEAEGHGSQERWLLTYADLITLLMVFFVVMYSMSRADVSKFARLQAAMQRAFRVEVLKGSTPTSLQGEDGSSDIRGTIQDTREYAANAALSPKLITTLEELRIALLQVPQPTFSSGGVQVGTARDGIVISLSGNVLFDSGKADLRPSGLPLLEAFAARTRSIPNEIRIEGHTDNIAIQTSLYPSNWELSSARATTVARYLSEHGRIPASRLIAAGYGEHRPAASNSEREGRARNRRVDLVILSESAVGEPVADRRSPTMEAQP
jgi:chemotaxis protein MotB